MLVPRAPGSPFPSRSRFVSEGRATALHLASVALLLCFLSACTGRTGSSSSSSSSSGETPDAGGTSSSGGGPAPGTLGAGCATPADCVMVTNPRCDTVLDGEPVASGVCGSSPCTVGMDCDNGAGRCVGNVLTSVCVLACSGAGTCTRPGFSCFEVNGTGRVCLPTSRAQCTPSLGSGCGAGENCVSAGPDDVGVCIGACNPVTQDCPMGQGCYVGGAGNASFCSVPNAPAADGEVCTRANACNIGRVCVGIFDAPRCYPTCDSTAPQPRCAVGNCQPLFGTHVCVPQEAPDAGM